MVRRQKCDSESELRIDNNKNSKQMAKKGRRHKISYENMSFPVPAALKRHSMF